MLEWMRILSRERNGIVTLMMLLVDVGVDAWRVQGGSLLKLSPIGEQEVECQRPGCRSGFYISCRREKSGKRMSISRYMVAGRKKPAT